MSTPEKATRLNDGALNAFERLPLSQLKIKGLGPARCKQLAAAGVVTAVDLLSHLPKAYVDYSQVFPIAQAPLQQAVHVRGRILSVVHQRTFEHKIPFVEALLDDGDGSLLLRWYRRNDLKKRLLKGTVGSFLGVIKPERSGRVMQQPRWVEDLAEVGGVCAVYAELGGLSSEWLAGWIDQLLLAYAESDDALAALDPGPGGLPGRLTSFRCLHQPVDLARVAAMLAGEDPAFLRLVYDECHGFQQQLQPRVQARLRGTFPALQHFQDAWLAEFLRQLPFRLTGEQVATLRALCQQLRKGKRLYGLVQGDVGCGKTVVGLALAFVFARAGLQVALMAPTTVLADQHGRTAQQFFAKLGVRVAVLHGHLAPHQQALVVQRLAAGEVDLVIGTHRLFQQDVAFAALGLALIDEQHRFGVGQRAALLKKGARPHYLAFSATPIPRGLALTVFGEVDLYQIKEKPKMRQVTRTILKKNSNREEVVAFVKKRLAHGEAVFWVAPLIEEGDGEQANLAAEVVYRQFADAVFPQSKVGLVHGRMDRELVDETMAQLRAGEIQLVVATTVIEVGVDVPQATVMVIEGANRFGLSQLHQLRGRVGRGSKRGYCFLMLDAAIAGETLKRMRLLERSNDGFEIAAMDLEWRGAGELLGKRQSGLPQFRFCDLWRHRDVMALARQAVLRAEGGK